MRGNYNGVYLLTPNRPQVTNCLLLRQPHRPCSRRHSYPIPMRLYGGPNLDDRPRPHLLRTILPSQHKLRTHAQPHPTAGPRLPNGSSPNGNVMIPCKPGQSCPPSPSKPNRRVNGHYLTIQLILMDPRPHGCRNSYYGRLLPVHIPNDSARTAARTHPLH